MSDSAIPEKRDSDTALEFQRAEAEKTALGPGVTIAPTVSVVSSEIPPQPTDGELAEPMDTPTLDHVARPVQSVGWVEKGESPPQEALSIAWEPTIVPQTPHPFFAASGRLFSEGERFTRLRRHADGGLGRVYLARDEQLGRQVALKEILPQRADDPTVRYRFLKEAEITGQLAHPGIVPIYALEQDRAQRPVYAMRFIHGHSLSEVIKNYHENPTPLGLRELLQHFITVCQTLAYAHSQHIIHRDLKPANIMVGDYGETLVVDWGLAKRLRGGQYPEHDEVTSVIRRSSLPEAEQSGNPHENTIDYLPVEPEAPHKINGNDLADPGLTADGQVLGTPAYMAPEQARGEGKIGPPADVYALGAILYEILMGWPPYRGISVAHMLLQVLAGPPTAPWGRQVPKPLSAVCMKAMARAPEERYASAAELARDVQRWLADDPVSAFKESWRERWPRWARRHRTVVTASAVGIVLLAAAAVGFSHWRHQTEIARINRENHENERLRRNHDAIVLLLDQGDEALGVDQYEQVELALVAAKKRFPDGVPPGEAGDLADRLNQLELDLATARSLRAIQASRWEKLAQNPKPDTYIIDQWKELFENLEKKVARTSNPKLASWIKRSLIRIHLVHALDSWLTMAPSDEVRQLLAQVDADPFRDEYRDAVRVGDADAILRLTDQSEILDQTPGFLVMAAQNPRVPLPRRRELFYQALRDRHQYLDALMALAMMYATIPGAVDDVVRWCQAATAVEPHNGPARIALGYYLRLKNDIPGAITYFEQAIRLGNCSGQNYLDLGSILINSGRLDLAMESFQQALLVEPLNPKVHSHYGYILARYKTDFAASEVSLRRALELDPKFEQAHCGLGLMYEGRKLWREAKEAHREAIRCLPDYDLPHQRLAEINVQLGDYDDALEHIRFILRRYPDNRHYQLMLTRVEEYRALQSHMPDIRSGKRLPRSPEEMLRFAEFFGIPVYSEYWSATRFYVDFFAARPDLANALTPAHRYSAACIAARGGCGAGKDADAPNQRARLRNQALEWLRADLVLRQNQIRESEAVSRAQAVAALTHWQHDSDLALLRPGLRIGLPASERAAWDALWADVAAAIVQGQPPRPIPAPP